MIIHWDNTYSVTGTNPYSFSALIYIFLGKGSNPVTRTDFRGKFNFSAKETGAGPE